MMLEAMTLGRQLLAAMRELTGELRAARRERLRERWAPQLRAVSEGKFPPAELPPELREDARDA